MSETEETDEVTLLSLKRHREGDLDLFQEPTISTSVSRSRSPLDEVHHGFAPSDVPDRVDLNVSAEEQELDKEISEARQEFADLYAMESQKQAIKDHWNTNKKKLEDLIKEIDSKLDLFDDTVDNQATKNQQETTVLEAAWKDVKETHKQMKVVVDQIEEYDVTALEEAELSEIKIRSKKITEQADRRSDRYRTTNDIFRKCVEKSVSKRNNIKLETMMVPVLDTKLNNYTFGYWEGLVQTYVSTQCINDGAKKQFLLSKLDETAKSLVSSTEKYDDCMQALRRHFGDELRIRNEKIANFVRWSQERPTDIRETEKISKEITYIHCFVTNNLNQREKGCECPDKKGCAQDGHDVGDHCATIACSIDTKMIRTGSILS